MAALQRKFVENCDLLPGWNMRLCRGVCDGRPMVVGSPSSTATPKQEPRAGSAKHGLFSFCSHQVVDSYTYTDLRVDTLH